jgi:hypothetical protein
MEATEASTDAVEIPPNTLGVNHAGHGVAELEVFIADGMPTDDAASRLGHLREPAANDLLQQRRVAVFREAHNGKRRNRASAHGIDIAQRISGGNLTVKIRVVHNGREKIHGLHQGEIFGDQIHPGVVVGVEPNENVRVSLPRQAAQHGVQQTGTQLGRSTRSLDHGRQFDGLRQDAFPPSSPQAAIER